MSAFSLKWVLKEISDYQQNAQLTTKLLRDILRLDKNRMENLPKLRARVTRLEEVIKRFKQDEAFVQNLEDWVDGYKCTLETITKEIQKKFGIELEEELKKLGLSLSGQYPDLRTGLFTIELNFEKGKATLWYGPKQEYIEQCTLSASVVSKRIEKIRQELGSQLHEEELLEKLQEAYYRVVKSNLGKPAFIIEVLFELAHLLQSQRFRQDPKRENYKSYSRADFSYDLFRIRSSTSASKLHLTVATRVHTRRRSGFLWIPDDENGRGTTYSHLQFKEVKG